MEIDTAPRPPAPTPWGRLVLFVVLFAPVTLLVLLPSCLGLERYVITSNSMAGDRPGGIARGAVAFERVVPVGDLRVGDVITYPHPGAVDGNTMVTRRIVAIGPDGISTQGDAAPARDPWLLRPDGATLPRVVFSVPWIGWASLAVPSSWLLAASALVLAVLMAQRTRRRSPTLRGATEPAVEPGRRGRCHIPERPEP